MTGFVVLLTSQTLSSVQMLVDQLAVLFAGDIKLLHVLVLANQAVGVVGQR